MNEVVKKLTDAIRDIDAELENLRSRTASLQEERRKTISDAAKVIVDPILSAGPIELRNALRNALDDW